MWIILIIVLMCWEAYWTYHACWIASKLDEKKIFLFFSSLESIRNSRDNLYLQKEKRV